MLLWLALFRNRKFGEKSLKIAVIGVRTFRGTCEKNTIFHMFVTVRSGGSLGLSRFVQFHDEKIVKFLICPNLGVVKLFPATLITYVTNKNLNRKT